ncbi:hypothetical protein GMD78_05530 [Ornithinibacillus sp. L9]|uniref:Uncharacterized protein n=1 Tax=Ornithinibacillus caprae TaxID=2678566 RepID=A0A6N8FJD1_9BACI|nr:hypothetical protein [Ornithinibacillus caprae]MUK87859.1 hypothetical protein [Ornithinibacillus caprae]
MNKFIKWLIPSISLALISLIVVLNLEDWARLSGELNRNVILIGTVLTFALVVSSIVCLFKANVERKKNHIIISLFTSLVPLCVFLMNGVLLTVWFVGK